MSVQIVWFKRDLRLRDHLPLVRADEAARASGGGVVCLAMLEPEVLDAEDWADHHTDHLVASLDDLDRHLRRIGARLTYREGEAVRTLEGLLRDADGDVTLWSHQETGNAITYERDKRVARWCRDRGVAWNEIAQNGVVRGLTDRDGWAQRWLRQMNMPLVHAPERIACISGVIGGWDFGRPPATRTPRPERQSPGLARAQETLATFLDQRGVNYRADMASPLTGFEGCSRLSVHLAFGALSIREVHHALEERRDELLATPRRDRDPRWVPSMNSFRARLRWHCHFMQKLESEPAIEFRNMHRFYDGLRTEDHRDWSAEEHTRFRAWQEGRTGYPFVDACMRCLSATGWMNFRMRAMLVSFASHHLWLHWRQTGLHLARLFLDYEPGIHWSQMQMQSGTSGINTLRIYNPIKQGQDQDPSGAFIRRWVPELASLDDSTIHEPWKRVDAQGSLFTPAAETGDYPAPIVDHVTAYRSARDRLHRVRQSIEARAESRRVYQKHGSRKGPSERRYRGSPEDRAMS